MLPLKLQHQPLEPVTAKKLMGKPQENILAIMAGVAMALAGCKADQPQEQKPPMADIATIMPTTTPNPTSQALGGAGSQESRKNQTPEVTPQNRPRIDQIKDMATLNVFLDPKNGAMPALNIEELTQAPQSVRGKVLAHTTNHQYYHPANFAWNNERSEGQNHIIAIKDIPLMENYRAKQPDVAFMVLGKGAPQKVNIEKLKETLSPLDIKNVVAIKTTYPDHPDITVVYLRFEGKIAQNKTLNPGGQAKILTIIPVVGSEEMEGATIEVVMPHEGE